MCNTMMVILEMVVGTFQIMLPQGILNPYRIKDIP